MTNFEFDNEYHVHSIDKCCWFCEYSSGYEDCLDCEHPDRDINDRIINTNPFNICDEYKEREPKSGPIHD